ncbi:unnamed protein product [Lampetra planeri]
MKSKNPHTAFKSLRGQVLSASTYDSDQYDAHSLAARCESDTATAAAAAALAAPTTCHGALPMKDFTRGWNEAPGGSGEAFRSPKADEAQLEFCPRSLHPIAIFFCDRRHCWRSWACASPGNGATARLNGVGALVSRRATKRLGACAGHGAESADSSCP